MILILHTFTVSFLLSCKPQIVTLSISYTGFLSSLGFLGILNSSSKLLTPVLQKYIKYGTSSFLYITKQHLASWSRQSDVYWLLHFILQLEINLVFWLMFVLWHLWYQWLTTLDQKPHKSAAFSPDRMCSGYLLKVAVKPYPLILMFHFYICVPWDASVSLLYPHLWSYLQL